MLLSVLFFSVLSVFEPSSNETLFLQALEAQQQGRFADAYKMFDDVQADTDHLGGYATLEMAACLLAMGDRAGAETMYRALFEGQPESSWSLLARVRLARIKKQDRFYLDAAPHYRAILEIRPQPWWMYTYAWDAVDSLLRDESTQREGYLWYRHRVETVGFIRPRLDASRELIKSPWPEDQAVALLGMFRSNAAQEASTFIQRQGLDLLVQNNYIPLADLQQLMTIVSTGTDKSPGQLQEALSVDTENVWLAIWLIHFAHQRLTAKDFDQVLALADIIALLYPESRDSGDLYWMLAQGLENDDKHVEAEHIYERLAERAPNHYRADRALFQAGLNRLEKNQFAQAELFFAQLLDTYPNSRWRGEAYYKLAQHKLDLDDKSAAIRYLQTAAGGRMADYYAHRALARLHDFDDTNYPLTRNLRIDSKNPVLLPKPNLSRPTNPTTADINNRDDVRRLRFFGYYGIDLGEWDAMFLCMQLKDLPDAATWYLIVADAGFAHTALEFAEAYEWGQEEGIPNEDRLRLEFPRPYWSKMLKIANEVNIDPYLFLAIAKQESTFRAGIQSHAGATGVMQLMPATAKWMADVEPAITLNHVANLKSPPNSIRLGGYYLRRMIERSGGNLIHALAAYNAGPGNLDRWRNRFPNHTLDEFVEAIPFSETRDYVKKVLGNYAAYHSLYPAVDPRIGLAQQSTQVEPDTLSQLDQ